MRRTKHVTAALIATFLMGAPTAGGVGAQAASRCSRTSTARLVKGFVRALNNGDITRVDGRWANEPDFGWYFVDNERESPSAEDRMTLRAYFLERIALHDHIELRRLRVARDGRNFTFVLFRTTDDARASATGLFHGKGAARVSTPGASVEDPGLQPDCMLTVWAMDNHTR